MNTKTFVAVVAASVLGHFLIFFAVPEGASLRGGAVSLFDRLLLGIGFLFSLPVLPFSFAIDHLFNPRWAAIYTVLLATLLSATFLAVAAQQILLRLFHAKV